MYGSLLLLSHSQRRTFSPQKLSGSPVYSKFRTSFPHSFFCEKSTPQLTFYNKILFVVRRHCRVTHNKNLFPLFSRFPFFFSRTCHVILSWQYVYKFFRAYWNLRTILSTNASNRHQTFKGGNKRNDVFLGNKHCSCT